MKRIFTLFTALLLTVALFAADRRPVVTVNSSKNYKIVIDGRSYYSNDRNIRLANLNNGRHTIKVFEMKRMGYNQRERLVAATSFHVNRKNVHINIDRFGNINIREVRNNGRFDNDRDWDDRDYRDDNRRF